MTDFKGGVPIIGAPLCYLCTRKTTNFCLTIKNYITMSKVFQIKPKKIKRVNGQVLTPEMVITVTLQMHSTTPFYNGAKEIQVQYMRMFGFDYKKACCSVSDFDYKALD